MNYAPTDARFWFRVESGHVVSHSTPSYTLRRVGPSRNPQAWAVYVRGTPGTIAIVPKFADAKAFAITHLEKSLTG